MSNPKGDLGIMDLYLTLRCQAINSQQSKENCENVKETIKVEECCDIVKGIPRIKKYEENTSVCRWSPDVKKRNLFGKEENFLGKCEKDEKISGKTVAKASDEAFLEKVKGGIAAGKTTWEPEPLSG